MKQKIDPGLVQWIEDILMEVSDRTVSVDLEVCKKWSEFLSIDSANLIDSLLAAQSAVCGIVLATGNTNHFQMLGINYFNPFVE